MAAMKVEVILPAQEVSGQVVGGGQREGGQGVHPVQSLQLMSAICALDLVF